MGAFTPSNSWSIVQKYAGISDSRQVREVLDFLNLIEFGEFQFCRLFGGKSPGQDNNDNLAPVIPSQSVSALKPELYDYEVAPDVFRLTTDTAALDVDSTATLTLDSNAGLNVGDVINKIDIEAHGLITSLTGTTQCGITVIYSAQGSVIWSGDTSVKYIEKLSNAQADGPSVGVGTNREPTNRYNYLQFGIVPMSQGILQKNLELYAMAGKGPNADWMREKKQKMIDFQRQREAGFIAGRRATYSSGADRVYTANGLLGHAGTVYNNTTSQGELTFDTFNRSLMPKARSAGGGRKIYGLCGNTVAATITNFADPKIRFTNPTKKYESNIVEVDVAGGTLVLLTSDFMDKDARRGQMITFQPKYLKRCFLRNMDVQWVPNLNVSNELADRATFLVCECLMASNPKSITVHTNILK